MSLNQYHRTINPASVKLTLILFLFCLPLLVFPQEKKRIEIIRAGTLEADEKIAPNAQRLIDSVLIRHKDILIWCDSAYNYTATNRVDAFGNVHINQGDTLHLYAHKVFYDANRSFARAMNNVRLKNKSITLYSDTVDFDIAANIGYYDDKGKIIDSTNILTSVIGKYYIDDDLIHFIKNVHGYNENYNLYSDTLFYNTETEVFDIEGPTTIQDSTNNLYAEDGWYNTVTGEAELTKKPEVFNDKQLLRAAYIKYNEKDGNGMARESVHIHDYENSTIVEGMKAVYNESIEMATVTDSAVFIMYSEKDTLYLHADTLRTVPDTIEGEKVINAFYQVRFYRNDLQGLCDSLVYYTKDSVVQLHNNPVIWSDIHQLSADLIQLKQHTHEPDEMHLNNNSFIISKQDSGQFDQIKGKDMIGYIVNNEINTIDVDGNGQTLYYAREEDEIIGLNRAESSNIRISFEDGKIHRIAFLKSPTGNLKPLFELSEEEKKLSGFDWKIQLRPLSKHDIFPREEIVEEKEPDEEIKQE